MGVPAEGGFSPLHSSKRGRETICRITNGQVDSLGYGIHAHTPRRHRRNQLIASFAQGKYPSDKIIEIIHPTTATSTQGKGTTGGDSLAGGCIYSSSSFFFDLLGRSCRRVLVSARIFSNRQNITYSWINMGYNTTLADYDIAE